MADTSEALGLVVQTAVTNALMIQTLAPSQMSAWKTFLTESENSTLFNDLEFLGYQPQGIASIT